MPRKPARRNWGTGSIKYRQDGMADIRWYENGVQKKKCSIPAGEAQKTLNGIMDRVNAGMSGWIEPSQDFKTLNGFAVYWFDNRMTRNNEGDRARYDLHIRPTLGHLGFGALSPIVIKNRLIVPKLKEGLSGATVQNMVRILSSMLGDAIEFGLLPTNPCSFSKKTRALMRSDWDPKTSPWLQKGGDVIRVVEAMEGPVKIVYARGVFAGLRPGETRAMDWKFVDFEHDRIVVCQQVDERAHEIELTKDRDSRVVPMIPPLRKILEAWWIAAGKPTSGLLVSGPANFLGVKVIARAWHRTREKLGLPKMRLYDASRHTFATHWVLNGGSRDEVQDLLGHSSPQVSERYIHAAKTFELSNRKMFEEG
jgi:integrase